MNDLYFSNRQEAAEQLLPLLEAYRSRPESLILGLARGGVVLAAVLGRQLQLPFYPFIVRKIGCPGNPEYAIGALAEGGTVLLNKKVIQQMDIPEDAVDRVIAEEEKEVGRWHCHRKHDAGGRAESFLRGGAVLCGISSGGG